MAINREGEDVAHGLVDDAETVGKPRCDGGDCPRHLGTTVVTTHAVDGPSIRYTTRPSNVEDKDDSIEWHIRNNAGGDVVFEQRHTGIVPVVAKLDDLTCGSQRRGQEKRDSTRTVDSSSTSYRSAKGSSGSKEIGMSDMIMIIDWATNRRRSMVHEDRRCTARSAGYKREHG